MKYKTNNNKRSRKMWNDGREMNFEFKDVSPQKRKQAAANGRTSEMSFSLSMNIHSWKHLNNQKSSVRSVMILMWRWRAGSRPIASCNGLWFCVNIYRRGPGSRRGSLKMASQPPRLFTLELSRGFPSDGSHGAFWVFRLHIWDTGHVCWLYFRL